MITQTRSQATGPIVAKTFLAGLLGCLACQPAPVLAVDPAPRTPPPEARMSDIVETRLYPQLDYFFTKLSEEKEAVTLDGVVAFKGKDKFLPGKIAVGLSYLLVNTPRSDPRFARYLKDSARPRLRASSNSSIGGDSSRRPTTNSSTCRPTTTGSPSAWRGCACCWGGKSRAAAACCSTR
jgi:hypothetical protein